MGKSTKVTLEWNKPIKQVADQALNKKATLNFMGSTWRKLYTPFVPRRDGALFDNVNMTIEGDAAINHHTAPYARRMYYGDGFNFSKERHPEASARWDQAAAQAGKYDVLVKDTQNFINRG